jgi:hypothetical protein
MCDEECLGENPSGFPTQRAALGKKVQLQWMGGILLHPSLGLLLLCNSLVQILCVSAVCM